MLIRSSRLLDLAVHGFTASPSPIWGQGEPMPRRRDQELLQEVGSRVGQARRDRGWTQEALAEAVGVEPVTLSRLETGDRALSLTMLSKIADVLAVGLGELLDVQRQLPAATGTPEEVELARLFAGLAPSGRDLVLRLARELTKGTSERP